MKCNVTSRELSVLQNLDVIEAPGLLTKALHLNLSMWTKVMVWTKTVELRTSART